MANPIRKDLGLVTAYGAAKEKGYTGTEEEFKVRVYDVIKGKIPVDPAEEPTEEGSVWITTQ